ncbi:MAG: hypothetical protein WC445_00195 [Patescibacteria group bacterium]
MKETITLAEARKRLGENVVVCLEPDAVREKKVTENKAAELWIFDPATGWSCRGDGKFHDARYVDRGGWGQIALYEEPNVPQPEDGSPRVVGHVVIEMNRYGAPRVRVRRTKGLNGEVLELKPSSISKGELADKGKLVGTFYDSNFVESNPQRIMGMIAIYLVNADFPDEEGMTPDEFRRQSTDGRSLSALAKAGL